MLKFRTIGLVALLAVFISACSNTPKLASQPMPRSGFLQNYAKMVPVSTREADTRVWRYRKSGIDRGTYTAVILDPIYINQNVTKEVSAEAINRTKSALQSSMVEAVNSTGNIKIVTEPGPGVARISVGITGAESSADSLQPWNFTPVGLAINAAAYAGGVNSKTPAMLVESKITDSQSKEVIGEGIVTVQGESFRTGGGSVESFVAMARTAVRAAIETSGNTRPTASK
jgi:hypothetical protein